MLIRDVCQYLDILAPSRLAEDWDNVGLLVGDPAMPLQRIMTCLTVTPASAAEAVERGANLVVTHHPLPFKALKRITTDETPGRLLWELIHAGVAIYSAHTAWDSAAVGINQQLAEGLHLTSVVPLEPQENDPDALGSGRHGELDKNCSLGELITRLKSFLGLESIQYVGHLDSQIARVGVACGAAGSFLPMAHRAGCDALVLGETNFHTCLEAEALDVALLLPGHFASERFALDRLAEHLANQFPDLTVWSSESEQDPLKLSP